MFSNLRSSVETFTSCVASLRKELFLSPLKGDWTPRDIVAHLIGWSRYIIEGSNQLKIGQLPFYDVDPGENYSKVNAVLVREYSSGNRDELLNELKIATQGLEDFLQSLDPGEWDHDYSVRHKGLTVTIRNSVDEVIEGFDHHKEQINKWVNRSAS